MRFGVIFCDWGLGSKFYDLNDFLINVPNSGSGDDLLMLCGAFQRLMFCVFDSCWAPVHEAMIAYQFAPCFIVKNIMVFCIPILASFHQEQDEGEEEPRGMKTF